jgi:hypothetical protein
MKGKVPVKCNAHEIVNKMKCGEEQQNLVVCPQADVVDFHEDCLEE